MLVAVFVQRKLKSMLVTKEQQEALVDNYIKNKHNQDECIGFIDGINAALELLSKIDKRSKEEQEQMYCQCKSPILGSSVSRCGNCDKWFKRVG